MEAVTEDGDLLGVVEAVEAYPAGDMYLIRDGDREHLIPAVPEMIVRLDVEGRKVVIRPTPGLLDLSS